MSQPAPHPGCRRHACMHLVSHVQCCAALRGESDAVACAPQYVLCCAVRCAVPCRASVRMCVRPVTSLILLVSRAAVCWQRLRHDRVCSTSGASWQQQMESSSAGEACTTLQALQGHLKAPCKPVMAFLDDAMPYGNKQAQPSYLCTRSFVYARHDYSLCTLLPGGCVIICRPLSRLSCFPYAAVADPGATLVLT